MDYKAIVSVDRDDLDDVNLALEGNLLEYELDDLVKVFSANFANGYRSLLEVRSGGFHHTLGSFYPGFVDGCIVDEDGEDVAVLPPSAFDKLQGSFSLEVGKDTFTIEIQVKD